MKTLYKLIASVLIIALIPTFIGERVIVEGDISEALKTFGLIILASGYLTIFWGIILPAASGLFLSWGEEPAPEEQDSAENTYGDAAIAPSSLLTGIFMTYVYGSIAIAIMLVLVIGVTLMAPSDLDVTDNESLSFSEKLGLLCHSIVTGCGFVPALVTIPLVLLVWAAKATLDKN